MKKYQLPLQFILILSLISITISIDKFPEEYTEPYFPEDPEPYDDYILPSYFSEVLEPYFPEEYPEGDFAEVYPGVDFPELYPEVDFPDIYPEDPYEYIPLYNEVPEPDM